MIIELYYEEYWGSPVLCETIALDDGQPGITYHRGRLPDALRQALLTASDVSGTWDIVPDSFESEEWDDLLLLEAGDRQPLPSMPIHVKLRRALQRFTEVFRKLFA